MIKKDIKFAREEGCFEAHEIAEFTGHDLGEIKEFLHKERPNPPQPAPTTALRSFTIKLDSNKEYMFKGKPIAYWEGLMKDLASISSQPELLTKVIQFQTAVSEGQIISSKSKKSVPKLDVTERSDGTFDLKRAGDRGRPTNFNKLNLRVLTRLGPIFEELMEKENFQDGGYQFVVKVRDREMAELLFEGQEIFEKCGTKL